jgi:PIN domain nuclease of toxin-antitoxin system
VKILLDTHALLWWASSGGSRLSPRAREVIESAASVVLVSVASIYEIAIKTSLGRLGLPSPPDVYVPAVLRQHGFESLPIDQVHALRAGSLPLVHRDPWDRLLVAQAQVENIPIVTGDPAIGRYDVEVVW